MGLTETVPFLLEDELIAKGANYTHSDNFQVQVVIDGMFITGQNPASAQGVANTVVKFIKAR